MANIQSWIVANERDFGPVIPNEYRKFSGASKVLMRVSVIWTNYIYRITDHGFSVSDTTFDE